MPASILVIEHADSCRVARVGDWLSEAGAELTVLRGHRGEMPPEVLTGFDALVVLGGPMNAYADADHPWLAPTRELLRQAVAADLPTLGICLGHQLLAVAAGGTVELSSLGQRAAVQAVERTPEGLRDSLFAALPEDPVALYWNGDVVASPPAGAVVLAESQGEVEAFRLKSSVYGVQFHPEVDVDIVRVWAENDVTSGGLSRAAADHGLSGIASADGILRETWKTFTQAWHDTIKSG